MQHQSEIGRSPHSLMGSSESKVGTRKLSWPPWESGSKERSNLLWRRYSEMQWFWPWSTYWPLFPNATSLIGILSSSNNLIRATGLSICLHFYLISHQQHQRKHWEKHFINYSLYLILWVPSGQGKIVTISNNCHKVIGSLCVQAKKLRVKIVTISDFCHKVVVTISDKDCTGLQRVSKRENSRTYSGTLFQFCVFQCTVITVNCYTSDECNILARRSSLYRSGETERGDWLTARACIRRLYRRLSLSLSLPWSLARASPPAMLLTQSSFSYKYDILLQTTSTTHLIQNLEHHWIL